MLSVNVFKSESKQGFEVFYFGSGEVASICSDIKDISNKSKSLSYDSIPVTRSYVSERLNPLYKSCKTETESSLYDGYFLENTNKIDEIKKVKEILGKINDHLEVIPDIRVCATLLFEAKSIIEQSISGAEIFDSLPNSVKRSGAISSREPIAIEDSDLYKLKDSIKEICDKPTLSRNEYY